MIKLFASDLDGTLLNSDHKMDEIIEKVIKEVNQNEKHFCIATGRSMYTNHIDDFKGIQGQYYCAALNGAIITNKENKVIYKKTIDQDFLMEMLEKFPNLPYECLGVEKMYYKQSRKEVLDEYQRVVQWSKFHQSFTFDRYHENTIFEFTKEQLENVEILKVNCKIKDPKLKEEFSKFVNEHSDKVVNAPFMKDFFELTHVSVNKGNAVKMLAQLLDVSDDEVAVYGDGLNDLSMLEMFKHSYAPSNASPPVQACANEIIGSYLDHAVSKHIQLLLNEGNSK